jgi:hypothetical protein
MSKATRRAVLAGIAAAPAVAVSALAAAAAEPEAIYAAIERYKFAVAERMAALSATRGYCEAPHQSHTVVGVAALLDVLSRDPCGDDDEPVEPLVE